MKRRDGKTIVPAAAAILAVGLGLAAAATAAVQGPGPFGPGPHMGRHGGHGPGGFATMRMLRRLDLTEEQKEQLRALREESREALAELRRNVFEAQRALREAIEEGADEYVCRERATAVGTYLGDLAVAEADFYRKMLAVLTPEQKAKLDELKSEAEAKRRERIERFREERER